MNEEKYYEFKVFTPLKEKIHITNKIQSDSVKFRIYLPYHLERKYLKYGSNYRVIIQDRWNKRCLKNKMNKDLPKDNNEIIKKLKI